MPKDNSLLPSDNSQQQTTTPPPVLEDVVLPPMVGDKPLAAIENKIPTNSGSAAPSDDIVMQSQPISSNPRKKFAGGKVIATILGLFLLVGGLGAGIMLVGQNQNVEEQAAGLCGYCSGNKCVGCGGGKTSVGECSSPSDCAPGGGGADTPPSGGSGNNGNPVDEDEPGECGFCNGTTCVGCGGGRLNVGECTSSAQCGAGVPGINCGNGQCQTGENSYNCPNDCFSPGATCGNGQCESSETFNNCSADCAAPSAPTGINCTGSATVGNDYNTNSTQVTITQALTQKCTSKCGDATLYASVCKCSGINMTEGCNTNCETQPIVNGAISATAPTCGTVQIDVGCKNTYNTYGSVAFASQQANSACSSTSTTPPSNPPAPTPTAPPVITASCQNVKAYTEAWVLLTQTQLGALKPTNKVNFCVAGVASGGSFNKAKFTINGSVQAETTTKRPNSEDFCQLYVIPVGVSTFNVSAQINHITLGWK